MCSPRRRTPYAFTLIEVAIATFIIGSLSAAAFAFGHHALTRVAESNTATVTLDAAVQAHELTFRRFASFTDDPQTLSAAVAEIGFTAGPPDGPTEAVVAVGEADDGDGILVDAAVAAVVDGDVCRWVAVLDLAVDDGRTHGEVPADECTAGQIAAAAGLT